MTEPSGIFEGHERRERGNNEVSGIQRNKEPPTGTFVRAPMSVSLVNFRSFAQKVASDGSFIDFEPREVTFVDAYHKELPESSKISFAGQESTLPMAFDNQRFFQGDDGYQDLLNQASREMDEIGLTGDAWREPAKEMGLLGWLWRMVVKFLMWLTNDAVNRLRFTRGIQDALPFQSAYESFAVGGVVRAFDVDDRGQDDFNLKLCFKNRNASRVLVQNLSRWDRVWHLGTQITWSRSFDMFGRLPFIGFTGFPATENFASTRTLAIRGTVRLLFQGSWLARYLSGNQQANVTLDSGTAAQNLAAEGGSSSEASNRNQFGTYIGREKTNGFRFEHRLSVDESIVRTFVTNPASTMVNNGVEHVLRCLAKHWRNMLYQENGNFAHQRMEQLNPFETLRFHMPIVLSVLANLRGRNVWDTTTLGPFIKRLERLNPEKIKRRADVENGNDALDEIYGPCQAAKAIVEELVSTILPNVCGGVPSRVEPFEQWLSAMRDAIDELCSEAETVKEFVSSVDIGIKLGYQLLRLVDWRVPTEGRMANAVVDFILDSKTLYPDVPRELINSALHKLNSKDERTVKELVKQGLRKVEAATLLIGRTCTLLEREFRRKALDERILKLAKGPVTTSDTLEKKKWYWVDTKEGSRVVVFRGAVGSHIKVVDVETNIEQLLEGGPGLSIREYIPIAEAISRAQKVFMIIEVDYGKKFPYNAFMEFGSSENPDSLRFRLRRLVILSQVQCSALDQARLNVLAEIKSSVQQIRTSSKFEASRLVAECKPQNATFLGGGPTGLLGAIHCLQNVILSGGEVKVYEGRDAFDQDGSSFERAQIVRLDSRQISMLRYHLGTGYEDVYIPAKGETDAHHGNTFPTQGFVEVTIKRLESMILDEIINLRSKGLLDFHSDSRFDYDPEADTFTKKGRALKEGDRMFDSGDNLHIMEVKGFVYSSRVTVGQLVVGNDYDIVLPREKISRNFRLVQMDTGYDFYQFVAHEPGVKDVTGSYSALPPVYLSGKGRVDPTGIIVDANGSKRELPFDAVKEKTFRLDFSATHVIIASGKPEGSLSHFNVTTKEPHAVCCIEGIKISMGMHNFGEKRWGSGLIDDIRSHSDQNTRIVGDFTKSVVLVPIIERMYRKLSKEPVWKYHFDHLAESLKDKVPSLHNSIHNEFKGLCDTLFTRERLQTRFFELGNNYYLGMELPREYDLWKNETIPKVAPDHPATAPDSIKSIRKRFQRTLASHMDRLWYEATLEVIAEGDVYNPGGKGAIPKLYTIESPFEQPLGELKELEAFRLFKKVYRVETHDGNGLTLIKLSNERDAFAIPTKTYVLDLATQNKRTLGDLLVGDTFEPIDTFEIIAKQNGSTIVRNSGGHISIMPNKVRVGRASDLARGPNGYSESNVALASFPVSHIVSHRTLRVNHVQGRGGDDGFITAFVGDAQASPHFMRYSGLTGACINCMSFNNLVGQALQGVPFQDRIQRYSFETTWSNGEVVQRGTGANYGEDAFLRPGFTYHTLVDYLFGRVLEHYEIGADTDAVLSRDWKIKLAASIVPRGLEIDGLFYESLIAQLEKTLRNKLEDEIKQSIGHRELTSGLAIAVSNEMVDITKHLKHPLAAVASERESSGVSAEHDRVVKKTGLLMKSVANALKHTIDYSVELREGNLRLSSELYNQPKPVDSVVDDFAVEAQNFANILAESAAYAAATIAFNQVDDTRFNIASAVLAVWNISISFSTMTNISRYRNRNEEARRKFFDEKMLNVMKAVFSLMTRSQRESFVRDENPFIIDLDHLVAAFVRNARYYNIAEAKILSFEQNYDVFRNSSNDQTSSVAFTRQLLQEFIPDTFHENSYLQENLVNIYKALDEMLALKKQAPSNGRAGADELYRMLLAFRPELSASIERGSIKYGFVRDHAWYRTPFPVTIQRLLSPLLCRRTISHKTYGILKAVEAMRAPDGIDKTLGRPVQDLTEHYHATNESGVGSMIFVSAFSVFCFSVFFTIFRIVGFASTAQWVHTVLMYAPWASIASTLGSTIAITEFTRKLRILFSLDAALGRSNMKSDPRIKRIRSVTRIQEFLTVVRLTIVVAASIALPWSVAEATFHSLGNNYSFAVSIVTAVAALSAAIVFFFVEFVVRYNLDPRLGRVVCEPFQARIEDIKSAYTKTDSAVEIETTLKLEREAWEYTARQFLHEYRFDAVFAADRFGTILQHLQSGNKLD